MITSINTKRFFVTILISVLTISGCNDYLDVESRSTLTDEAVFSSVSYTKTAILGVYNQLMGNDGYGDKVAINYTLNADDFMYFADYNPANRYGLTAYGPNSENDELLRPFQQFYRGIERANLCISQIPRSPVLSDGSASDIAAMNYFLGEALTLRALFYHELIRNWGDLPAPFKPASETEDLYLPKENRDVVYDRLLDDLEYAASLIPWRSQSSEPSSRITKQAVKAFRARLALVRGGYSLRRESNLMERRPDYLEYYKIAHKELKEIIEKGENGLNPSFENTFKYLHTRGNSYDGAREMIFEATGFRGQYPSSRMGYSNGPRFHELSSWGKANGTWVTVPTYFYEFDTLDMRRDVTIAPFAVNERDELILQSATGTRDGKFRKNWTPYTDDSNNLGISWPMMRYADVLLMFAEADNEINKAPSAAAIKAYEDVRRRAFTGNEDKIGKTPTDYEGFFNAIVKERLLEFGGEGIRKYDLIRWNLLAKTIKNTRDKLRRFMNGEGEYQNAPEFIYYIPKAFKNAPSAQEEMANINFVGKTINQVFHSPGEVPAGSVTRVRWRNAVEENLISSSTRGYCYYFQENKSELFPIHIENLSQNYNLTQDYGL